MKFEKENVIWKIILLNAWFEIYAYFNIIVISWVRIWMQVSFSKCWHCHLFWSSNSTEHIRAPLLISIWPILIVIRVVMKCKKTWKLCPFFLSFLMIVDYPFFSPNLSKEESKRICAREWLQISQNGEHRTTEYALLQKTAFSLVMSRLALWSPGCSFVRSIGCHYTENGPIHKKMVVDWPTLITSKVRWDQERGRLVQPAFCIVDTELLLLLF